MAELTDIVREENAPTTLYALVNGVGGRVTRDTLFESLLLHPEFPSLLSLSEVLSDFAIENAALQLNTVEQLRELPLPFVAHTRKHGGWYVLVTAIQSERITYTDSAAGRTTEAIDAFARQWSGVVLLAEASEQSGEADYADKHQKETVDKLRGPLAVAMAVLLLAVSIANVVPTFKSADWLLLLTKSVGLALSLLLVRKQLGGSSSVVDRLCRINEKTDCDSVLISAGATIRGGISWSDVGLIYFAGGLLALLAGDTNHSLLYVLSLLGLPYVAYSVYYQWRVVQQWCTLCLAVQAVLLVEALIAFADISALTAGIVTLKTILTFLIAITGWTIAKSALRAKAKQTRHYYELMRFKRDPTVFVASISKQPRFAIDVNVVQPLVVGNSAAEHTLTVVTNPYCTPCARVHRELDHVLQKTDKFRIEIVFAACDRQNANAQRVASRLLALGMEQDVTQVLSSWYAAADKQADKWLLKWTAQVTDSSTDPVIDQHCHWCAENGINQTPTLLINGSKLPPTYSLSSLTWLVNYLSSDIEK